MVRKGFLRKGPSSEDLTTRKNSLDEGWRKEAQAGGILNVKFNGLEQTVEAINTKSKLKQSTTEHIEAHN